MPTVTLLPDNRILPAEAGMTLHGVLAREGLLDAPCGGQGTCGKCRVLVDGQPVLACQTRLEGDVCVTLPQNSAKTAPKLQGTRAAFDIGTTTVVCYLVSDDGKILAQAAAKNPQYSFGADVISRIRAALDGKAGVLTDLIRNCTARLLADICADPTKIDTICVVGNPAMQEIYMGRNVENLAKIPFKPAFCVAKRTGKLLSVPAISGFVGADTVAGILACGIHEGQEMTLLVDIGTNGEMVLGNKDRLMACSTAAGPALEGANIQFGMRAEAGAIDRVFVEQGQLRCRTIGNAPATGICGSGLIDAIAGAMDLGLLNRRGKIADGGRIPLTDSLYLTQADIRQVQLAKGAIRAGIELMAREMGIGLGDIQKVVLAGAFGSCLNPESACRMGLLPQELLPKITAGGNTAGQGAVLLAAHPEMLAVTDAIVEKTEFLELAALPAFPKTFAKATELPENWGLSAKAMGFDEAITFDPGILQAEGHVRAMCEADKCRTYGKNWTCPPHCGSLAECEAIMHRYGKGILLQTVGRLSKDIDSRGYRETEQRHLQNFSAFCHAIRRQHPDALCLGAGGCRVCRDCAYPEPCRFPDKAMSSMEGYGLFVTRVCREAGLAYYHGEKTVTYTACVLFGR